MILVYTVNFGGYDVVNENHFKDSGVDYLLFTYDKQTNIKGWQTVALEPKEDVLKHSREVKINIHQFCDEKYKIFIYIDANYQIKKSLKDYSDRYYRKGVLMHKHPSRKCIFDEAVEVVNKGLDSKSIVYSQMRKYDSLKMPKKIGLTQNGFFIRDTSANKFFEYWYSEVKNGSYRDQLSFIFCLFKYRFQDVNLHEPYYFQSYLKLNSHFKERTKINEIKAAPKVWYFVPGRGDKNLGEAYNMHCNAVPDGDWICIMDGDVIFLNPYWSKQIEDIIIKHGDKYPLISCLTNRLGLAHQLPYGFSEDPNILNHAKIADDHFNRYYDDVVPSPSQTAGLFMLFPKTTWNKIKFVPGLTNGGTFVDFTFADSVMKNIGKIGIAKGIYIFHFYRFNRKHKRDWDHLK